MKQYEKIFSGLFVLMMAGCIVFEVESWPFSDWRVYQYVKKPSDIRIFQVRLKQGEKIIEPKDFSIKIDLVFNNHYAFADKDSFKSYCSSLYDKFRKDYQFDAFNIDMVTVNDEMEMNHHTICSKQMGRDEFTLDWK